MNSIERRNKRRILLILDCIAMILSYVLALRLRYGVTGGIVAWQRNVYSVLLVLEVLIYALIFHYRYHIKRRPFITEQDPVDGAVSVVKSQIGLGICLLIVLFATHLLNRISRLAFGYMFLINVVLMYLFRMVWRHILNTQKKISERQITQNLLLVTYERDKEAVTKHLEETLPGYIGICGPILYDNEESRASMYDVDAIVENKDLHTEVLLMLPSTDQATLQTIIRTYTDMGYDVHVDLSYFGFHMSDRMLRNVGDYSTAFFTAMKTRCRVLHTDFAVTDMSSAIMFVRNQVDKLPGEYICFSNVHTTVMGRDDEAYAKVQQEAAYVFPDGKPIANIEKRRGYSIAERISGPDFMELMFRATMDGSVCHYFYGSDEETIRKLGENLKKRYPGMQIAGLYSPPYRALTPEEDAADMARINAAIDDCMARNENMHGALVWVGLGAPKQENWMNAHKGQLKGCMMGVGAGFNFHAGTIKRAPKWMQKISLEWLYRLTQDPKRLLRRYFVTNTRFIWYSLTERKTK